MNMKNSTFATPAAALAIPKKPNTPAIKAKLETRVSMENTLFLLTLLFR